MGFAVESSADGRGRLLDRIDAKRQIWSTVALRRTTLVSGHGVVGLVYVPLAADARSMWLGVPVGDHLSWFAFEQTVVESPHAPEARSST